MKRLHILIALALILQSAMSVFHVSHSTSSDQLAVDASAQGTTLTIVVFADAPSTLRITLPDGWTGAPHELQVAQGVQVLSYELQPGNAVGQGTIVVQAWAGSAYASDRAWVWGRVPETARAERPGVRARLAIVRR